MQTELAKIMDVGKVTLGGLIDRLEAAGIVKRQPDLVDRRAKRVLMTPKGKRLLAEIQKIAIDVNARIMDNIGKTEIAKAENVLHRMKQTLISMDAVPGGSSGNDSATESEEK